MPLVVIVAALSFGPSAFAATPWSASGTATTTLDSDGTVSPAQFSYAVSASCCASGSWTFSTVADSTKSVTLNWTYSGYHAYFQVQAGLSAFVTSSGVTTTVPLVAAGPVNCCSPPSGGFSYSGQTTLDVADGDTYGFMVSGSNFDSDGHLTGTLTVTGPAELAGPARMGYCTAPGNTDATTGSRFAPGTFVDLIGGQPDTDPNYAGATPANYLEGIGITCDRPSAGWVHNGFAVLNGLYPFYKHS